MDISFDTLYFKMPNDVIRYARTTSKSQISFHEATDVKIPEFEFNNIFY